MAVAGNVYDAVDYGGFVTRSLTAKLLHPQLAALRAKPEQGRRLSNRDGA